MNSVLTKIKGGLIVSCQALEHEPLHSPQIMARMAYAAMLGGAVGIRANSAVDIAEIKKTVDLPIIGLVKRVYGDNPVFITPSHKEIEELIAVGCDIIATDATNRLRPDGKSLVDFFQPLRQKYPDQLFMADCSTVEEGLYAETIGFDLIGTTLSGYTQASQGVDLPNYQMLEKLVAGLEKPLIAEGGIWTPDQLRKAMDIGAHAAVVGTAITRPMEITKYFIQGLS